MMKNCALTLIALVLALPLAAQPKYDFAAESEELSVPGETVQQAATATAQALRSSKMQLTISAVGFGISAGSEAELMLQDTARLGHGGYFTANDSGQLAQALGSAATGQTPGGGVDPNAVVLTKPQENDLAGPSLEIIGRTGPGQLVVIFTEVFRMDTQAKLRSVPGIRQRATVTGEIGFRIATPRVAFSGGEVPPRLRYEVHAYVLMADGTKGPEMIVNLLSPQ
jgi:hypothetical protein